MASWWAKDGFLYLDFRWHGFRCREATRLPDSPANRAQVKRLVRQIDGEIAARTFDYLKWFPDGPKREIFAPPPTPVNGPAPFADYVRQWLDDKSARLAPGTAYDWRRVVEGKLIPFFGSRLVSDIREEDVEAFLASLKRTPEPPPAPESGGQRQRRASLGKLGNRRVNIIHQVLRQSLDRAVKRGWLETNPARHVDRLREEKTEIAPLSLEEVQRFLHEGLRNEEERRYFTVAFFTGLRPGELIGLQLDDIDWARHVIAVRRSVTRFGEGVTKTVGSARDVKMLAIVERALRAQCGASRLPGTWVFPNHVGGTLNITNLRERIWKPALRRTGLRYRTMYQTRHTFATLMLAAGEDPGWIADQLGHTSVEMVFRRYHRFIPNLTRRDGSAVSAWLAKQGL
jgi:integrase